MIKKILKTLCFSSLFISTLLSSSCINIKEKQKNDLYKEVYKKFNIKININDFSEKEAEIFVDFLEYTDLDNVLKDFFQNYKTIENNYQNQWVINNKISYLKYLDYISKWNKNIVKFKKIQLQNYKKDSSADLKNIKQISLNKKQYKKTFNPFHNYFINDLDKLFFLEQDKLKFNNDDYLDKNRFKNRFGFDNFISYYDYKKIFNFTKNNEKIKHSGLDKNTNEINNKNINNLFDIWEKFQKQNSNYFILEFKNIKLIEENINNNKKLVLTFESNQNLDKEDIFIFNNSNEIGLKTIRSLKIAKKYDYKSYNEFLRILNNENSSKKRVNKFYKIDISNLYKETRFPEFLVITNVNPWNFNNEKIYFNNVVESINELKENLDNNNENKNNITIWTDDIFNLNTFEELLIKVYLNNE
ncbi:hypothetical protein [Mycoplasma leonicaptivi]|uniref:hypothetical protein n=1 Tax=Mycoplasma leonicaptivi TaxID=36742 RepID=UPI0004850690|nr:hypothetical protein [Mycoplasma leonicaptivi]